MDCSKNDAIESYKLLINKNATSEDINIFLRKFCFECDKCKEKTAKNK